MTAFGYVSVCLAAVLYGVQYVPVKKHEIYDGSVFQWFMCSGILFAGIVLGIVSEGQIPQATLQDLLGGMAWAVSNTLLLPVVKLLGLGLGFALFQATNVLSGYTIGRLGLFGATADPGRLPWLRDCGALCLCLSFLLMAFIKPPKDEKAGSPTDSTLKNTSLYVLTRQEDHGLKASLMKRPSSCSSLPELHQRLLQTGDAENPTTFASESTRSFANSAKPHPATIPREESGMPQLGLWARAVGLVLVLVAGFLNTLAALPFDWWLARFPAKAKSSFIFAQGLGAWTAGTILYIGYASLRRVLQLSSPQHSCIRPAMLSGALWSFGFVFMCLGIDSLGFTAGFTYCSVLPVAVSTVISIVVFGEIRGRQQISMFLSCFAVQMTGVLLIAAGSKS